MESWFLSVIYNKWQPKCCKKVFGRGGGIELLPDIPKDAVPRYLFGSKGFLDAKDLLLKTTNYMKKTIIIALLGLLSFHIGQAQSILDDLFGNDTQLIEKAIRKSCFVVRQDYALQDEAGHRYGSAGKDYFGRFYGIGIVSGNKLWMGAEVREAWVADPQYTPFKDSLQATPFKTALRSVDSTAFMTEKVWQATVVDGVAFGGFDAFEGAPLGEEAPERGRLAVFYTDSKIGLDSAAVQMTMAQVKSIQWEADGTAKENSINLKGKHILGGALFMEKVGHGMITFELAGLYVKLGNDWKLHKISHVATPAKPAGALTPIDQVAPEGANGGNKKKKKKN